MAKKINGPAQPQQEVQTTTNELIKVKERTIVTSLLKESKNSIQGIRTKLQTGKPE